MTWPAIRVARAIGLGRALRADTCQDGALGGRRWPVAAELVAAHESIEDPGHPVRNTPKAAIVGERFHDTLFWYVDDDYLTVWKNVNRAARRVSHFDSLPEHEAKLHKRLYGSDWLDRMARRRRTG